MSMTSQTCVTTFSVSAWTVGRSMPARSTERSTRYRAAMTRIISTSPPVSLWLWLWLLLWLWITDHFVRVDAALWHEHIAFMLIMIALTPLTHACLSTLYIVYVSHDQLSTFYLTHIFSLKLDPKIHQLPGWPHRQEWRCSRTISTSDRFVARKMSNERRHDLKYYLHLEE